MPHWAIVALHEIQQQWNGVGPGLADGVARAERILVKLAVLLKTGRVGVLSIGREIWNREYIRTVIHDPNAEVLPVDDWIRRGFSATRAQEREQSANENPIRAIRGHGWDKSYISKRAHRVDHRADAGDFVGAEEVGFAEGGEDGEESFGVADFVAKIFEGVRQRVADRVAEGAEAEGVEEGFDLVLDADGAVLEVAVVEAEAGIDEDFFDAEVAGHFDLAFEVGAHDRDGIVGEFEVANFADVLALDVADDDGGVVFGDEAIHFFHVGVAGEIENGGAGFEGGFGDGGLVGFDGDENAGAVEALDDGEEFRVLEVGVGDGGLGEGGFGADIDDGGALGVEDEAAVDGGFSGEADALAIPGIGGEINDAHDRGVAVELEGMALDRESFDAGVGFGAIFFD